MKRTRGILRWARKPQLVAAILVAGLLYGAFVVLRPGPSSDANVSATVSAVADPPAMHVEPIVDCSIAACLALTFDDGPDRDFTPRVLDTLKAHNARSTFFVQGSRIAGKEELLRRMHAEGHEIGNHSWSHPYFTRISAEDRQAQIQNTQDAIVRAGVPAPRLFRPPYGDMDATVANEIPLAIIRWNIDPADWHPRKKQFAIDHLLANAKPGSIVVMHDTEGTTADMLDSLITQLEPHYKLVTVSEILNLAPGQRGTYFSR